VPPLAAGFSARLESAAALESALVPGAAVALVPGRAGAAGSGDWLRTCGKTQLAVSAAEWLWQSGTVDLLVWAAAASRASVLSAYAEAAVAVLGADAAGDAETIAGRFVDWLVTGPGVLFQQPHDASALQHHISPAAGEALRTC